MGEMLYSEMALTCEKNEWGWLCEEGVWGQDWVRGYQGKTTSELDQQCWWMMSIEGRGLAGEGLNVFGGSDGGTPFAEVPVMGKSIGDINRRTTKQKVQESMLERIYSLLISS